MEVGKYLDFHSINNDGLDFSTRLYGDGTAGNLVALPTTSGTLALITDNVASATKLANTRYLWGNAFTGEGDVTGKITFSNYDSHIVMPIGYIGCNTDDSYFWNASNHPIKFGTNDLERMRIAPTGNVLINTTTDAGYKLDVNGTGRFTGNVTAPTFIGNLNGNASSATSVIGTVPTNKGGTGLTSIGTAGQVLQVNIGGTGLEWGTVSVSEESRDKGVNNVTSLASLPISKRLVYATVTAATSISLSSAMEIGDELHIVVYNSSTSAVTQVLPNTGAFVSMSNSYISIPASRYVEINIICHATGSYIIRAGGVS